MSSLEAVITIMRADIATGKATRRSLGTMYAMVMAGHSCHEPDFWGPINRMILDANGGSRPFLEGVKKVAWSIFDEVGRALSGGTGDVRSALLEAARRIEDSLPGLPDENDAHFIARALLAIPNGELKNFRGYAPSVPPDDAREAAHEIISDLLSMCDASNWDADGYRDLEYSIRHEVYERLHDFAADWQQRIGALRAVERPADPSDDLRACPSRGWREAIEAAAKVAEEEPVPSDDPPHYVVDALRADPVASCRASVRVTISNIAKAIRALSPAPKDREGG